MRGEVVSVSVRFDESESKTRVLADQFRATAGKLTPISDFLLLQSVAGHTVPLGGTVEIEGTHAPVELADANIDSVRLIVRGIANVAGVTLQAYDKTNSVVLATLALTTSLGTRLGSWTRVAAKGGDREIVLRVVGDGANTQVLHGVRLQGRTVQFNA